MAVDEDVVSRKIYFVARETHVAGFRAHPPSTHRDRIDTPKYYHENASPNLSDKRFPVPPSRLTQQQCRAKFRHPSGGVLKSRSPTGILLTGASNVELGRVVLLNNGPSAGKLAAIVEIVDHKRVRPF